MRFAALAALLALGACQWDPPHQGARDSSVPPLTVEGYGAMHIGMSLADARTASGQALNAPGIDDDPNGCLEQQFQTTDGDKLFLMFEAGRLTRITASEGAPHTRTAQNVGVGSTDAEVRTAYQNLAEQPAKYADAPAHDLIAWSDAAHQSGIRFEIDAAGKVTAVHAGGPSIIYVEGCA